MMKTNKEWHEQHKMPKNATFEQQAAWHLEHRKICDCRPIPKKIAEAIAKTQIAS